jgi:YHS domain-containing protein
MARKIFVAFSVAVALCFAALTFADNMPGMAPASSSPPTTQPTTRPFEATDLHNTICPVSGDKVDNSTLVEVYGGKIYHLCCPDCHTDFEKDPAKYASAVAANPAKYGIK